MASSPTAEPSTPVAPLDTPQVDDLLHEAPRRWWQKRRHFICCGCGWRSDPHVLDRSGVGAVKLHFALVDHKVRTRYRCGGHLIANTGQAVR